MFSLSISSFSVLPFPFSKKLNSNEKYIVLADKLWKEKLDVSNENVFQEKSNDANKTV